MTKVIHCVISIDKFEQKYVVIKIMFQSPRFKDHMNNIGIDQSLINCALFEHRCLQSINKLYHHYGKCDNKQPFKDILETAIVSTPKGFTNNSPRYLMNPTPIKKQSARKSLFLFINILYAKKKTAIR